MILFDMDANKMFALGFATTAAAVAGVAAGTIYVVKKVKKGAVAAYRVVRKAHPSLTCNDHMKAVVALCAVHLGISAVLSGYDLVKKLGSLK